MKHIITNNKKFLDELSKHKVKCKCGHVIIMINVKSTVCNWCGRKIYKDKKEEFEEKLKKEMKIINK